MRTTSTFAAACPPFVTATRNDPAPSIRSRVTVAPPLTAIPVTGMTLPPASASRPNVPDVGIRNENFPSVPTPVVAITMPFCVRWTSPPVVTGVESGWRIWPITCPAAATTRFTVTAGVGERLMTLTDCVPEPGKLADTEYDPAASPVMSYLPEASVVAEKAPPAPFTATTFTPATALPSDSRATVPETVAPASVESETPARSCPAASATGTSLAKGLGATRRTSYAPADRPPIVKVPSAALTASAISVPAAPGA